MKVLFITHQFPPLNIGGSHRPFKFVKHLHRSGIDPVVITPQADAHRGEALDKAVTGLHEGTVILRTPVDPPTWMDRVRGSYYLNTRDPEARRWRRHLLAAADQAARDHDLKAVIISIPPFSTGALGVEVARRLKLPLLVDLRDAWSLWTITPYVSRLHFLRRRAHERRLLRAADAVTVTSPQTIADLQALHPMVPADRFHLVTNGYDQEPPAVPAEVRLPPATAQRPFTIGYVGSFYYTPYQRELMFKPWWRKKPWQWLQYAPRREDWRYRSPWAFFRALQALRQRRPDLFALVRVEFIGDVPPWLAAMVREHGLEDKVKLRGRVDHAASIRFQAACDALLITSAKVVGGRDYSIAGKTFEYVAQVKPMLAFVCEGAQHDLLERTGLAVHCPPDDPGAAADRIAALLEGRCTLRPDAACIRDLHIERITDRFAQVVKAIATK
ncbi:MAG: glycosyltransferase [Flavobacteriales bacterium]|nr:glycosyltransferase [Flavobacteriales bacterium]NUQ15262.1 glycosyltransferase [Flavobacteriales bacterium]